MISPSPSAIVIVSALIAPAHHVWVSARVRARAHPQSSVSFEATSG